MGTRRAEGPGAGLVDEWAVVVPLTAYNLGGDPTRAPAGEGQSHAGFSPGSRTTTKVRLALVSDGPRAVVEGRSQEITAAVPKWLRVILC